MAFITCTRIVASEEKVYLLVEWFEGWCNISMTDGEKAWYRKVTEAEVSERASIWDIDPKKYFRDKLQRYLSHQQSTSYSIEFNEKTDKKKLIWELEPEQNESLGASEVLAASVLLTPVPNAKAVTQKILDHFFVKNVKLDGDNWRTARNFDKMKAEYEKCLAQSERFKNEKDNLENDLFKKFVSVLNTKKAKLRELKQALEARSQSDALQVKAEESASSGADATCDEEDEDSGKGDGSDVDRAEEADRVTLKRRASSEVPQGDLYNGASVHSRSMPVGIEDSRVSESLQVGADVETDSGATEVLEEDEELPDKRVEVEVEKPMGAVPSPPPSTSSRPTLEPSVAIASSGTGYRSAPRKRRG
eukprot:jgi/Mesen1/4274/ME000022S03568